MLAGPRKCAPWAFPTINCCIPAKKAFTAISRRAAKPAADKLPTAARELDRRTSVNREQFYTIMDGEGTLDYEVYLRTKALLGCQTDYPELCNKDELQFQIVHQVEALGMKLIADTLLDIDEYLQQENTNRVLTLFRRIHAM